MEALIPLIFVAVGLVFAAIGVQVLRSGRRFERTAARAQGTVTDVRSRAVSHGRGSGLIWIPVVRFQTADGRTVEAETSGGTNIKRHEPGQALQVLYDPADPASPRVEGGPAGTFLPVVFIVLGALFALGGLALFAFLQALDLP